MTHLMKRALAIAAVLLAAPAARAASCTVSTTGVAFGAYDSLGAASLDSSGTVSWSCDTSSTLTIAIGRGSSSTYLPRRLSSGLSLADYNLYLDASCSTIWGDGTEGTSTWTGSGTAGIIPIFGRVAPRQPLPAGSYAWTIRGSLVDGSELSINGKKYGQVLLVR